MVGVWSDRLPAQADRIIASAKMENVVFMGHQTKKAPNQSRTGAKAGMELVSA